MSWIYLYLSGAVIVQWYTVQIEFISQDSDDIIIIFQWTVIVWWQIWGSSSFLLNVYLLYLCWFLHSQDPVSINLILSVTNHEITFTSDQLRVFMCLLITERFTRYSSWTLFISLSNNIIITWDSVTQSPLKSLREVQCEHGSTGSV